MPDAYIVDGVRTPVGSHGGSLAEVRPDDMAAHVIARLLERHPKVDPARIADVILGNANQAAMPFSPSIKISEESILRTLSPKMRKAVGQQVQFMQLLQDRPVVLVAPYVLTIK